MTKPNTLVVKIIGAVVVIGLLFGIYGYVNNMQNIDTNPGIPRDSSEEDISGDLVSVFQQELSDRALARGPHPVEGFDAQMLVDVYPGIEERDFDGVTTGTGSGEGVHSYTNGELSWERTSSNQPVTSAERSISQEGYATLLDNLSQRLDMPVSTREEVIAIVDAVDIPADIREHIVSKSDLIRVLSPRPLSVISSPLEVWGEARGTWYFEADFQLILVDWDGRIIAESAATAQDDWMTEEFVPFEGTIEFDNPSNETDFSKRGTLILQKANPSGLPENDDALEIPVLFE